MLINDIPDYWSADQALAIYEFLGDIQQQVWHRYELQLIELLSHQTDTNQLDLFEFNDEIPF